LKSLIIHTADDLGTAGPDYSNGWGLMNTWAASSLIKDLAAGDSARLVEAQLTTATNIHSYSVYCDGTAPLRVTLCWTDPPGPEQTTHDSRTPVLINDLDLKVIGPSGTNYPYRLNVNAPAAAAVTDAKNSVDNVEQVYLAVPEVGHYVVEVDVDGALDDDSQWYSLLLCGAAGDSDDDGLPDDWEMLYFGSAGGGDPDADPDGDGLTTLQEFYSGHSPVDAGSVFELQAKNIPTSGTNLFVITWDSFPGRRYELFSTSALGGPAFQSLSGEIPYPVNSYTDSVERAGQKQFYRFDVQMD
jgi:hypothetical protein